MGAIRFRFSRRGWATGQPLPVTNDCRILLIRPFIQRGAALREFAPSMWPGRGYSSAHCCVASRSYDLTIRQAEARRRWLRNFVSAMINIFAVS